MENKQVNQKIIEKLNELGLTISTCESITGGAVGATLVLVEHASNSYLGCLGTYATNAKIKLAKVKKETIDEYGTVSKQCAMEMANGAANAFKSDIAISTTGNASTSNPIEGKESGWAYICIKLFDKYNNYIFKTKYNNRVDIINECVAFVLNELWELIKGLKK